MKNGIDPQAFAARLKAASPDERRRLRLEFSQWMMAGTAAGRWWVISGCGLIGAAALAAVNWWPDKVVLALSAVALAAGVLLFNVGARRERAWREANPFPG